MAVVIDSRGVGIWIDDELARNSAWDSIGSVERALDQAEATYGLSEEDRQHHLDQLDAAEDILEQTGDLEDVSPSVEPVSLPPQPVSPTATLTAEPDSLTADEEQRRRQERAKRVAEVYAMYLALGQHDDDVQEMNSAPESAPQQKETVGISHRGDWWVVHGRGPELRLASPEAAEREAKRRVGWR